jgi:hypothetical protein
MVSTKAAVSHLVDLGVIVGLTAVYVVWLTVGTGVRKLSNAFGRLKAAVSHIFVRHRSDSRSA